MFRILFLVIGAIILYKLIFDFIIPVYLASRKIRRKFREMHEQQTGNDVNGPGQANTTQEQNNGKPAKKDYIDFEEIK